MDTAWRRREDWGEELNLVSRVAPVLQHIIPDEISCLTELGRELGGVPGTQVSGMEFFFLFLGHAVKWPPVVRRFAHFLRKHGLVPLTAPPGEDFVPRSATQVVAFLRELLQFAVRGTPEWTEMFSRMQVGSLDLCPGLGPLAVEFGLLARQGPGPLVKLGTRQYIEVPDPGKAPFEMVSRMLSVAFHMVEKANWRWPSAAREVPDFLAQGVSVTKLICSKGGLVGGKGDGYLVRSFVRNALVAQIAARLPDAMDTVTMAQAVGVVSVSAVAVVSTFSYHACIIHTAL
jgi:hypothetical protein